MPLPLPNLDDRSYADLVDEARSRIPSLMPEWTDHNPTDPGMMLIELFAWLAEQLIFRANAIPPANYDAFLRLLNGPGWTRSGDLQAAIGETVLTLRKRYRAVTADDYEYLATHEWPASAEAQSLGGAAIARARCVPRRDLEADPAAAAPGHISLVIVPEPGDDRPRPSDELRAALWTWLDTRRLLGTRLHVVGPRYLPVDLSASLVPRSDALPDEVRDAAIVAVRQYFDPLHGWDGRGWPFGRAVYVSEVFQLLDRLAGVDYVQQVGLSSAAGRELRSADGGLSGIQLEPDELVAVEIAQDALTARRGGAAR